jgi:tetratricopeptide (TPR) repeat protein
MNKTIQSILKQAELYRSQGLLKEAEQQLKKIEIFIQTNDKIKNKEKLLKGIAYKIKILNDDAKKFEKKSKKIEASPSVNKIIKNLFSTASETEDNGEDKNEAQLEGAKALLKFGQFESAFAEFEKLLTTEKYSVISAKNIIKCLVELDKVNTAVMMFFKWQSESFFSSEQLMDIRSFAEKFFEEKALDKDMLLSDTGVDNLSEKNDFSEKEDEDYEDFIDISSIAISFSEDAITNDNIELDVSFQSGNVISIIISSKDQQLIDKLKVGVKLDNVQYYSPVAIFKGSGTVSAKTKIQSGPKKGYYSLDIKVESM